MALARWRSPQAGIIEKTNDFTQHGVHELVEFSLGTQFVSSAATMVVPDRIGVEPSAQCPLAVRNQIGPQPRDDGGGDFRRSHDALRANGGPAWCSRQT